MDVQLPEAPTIYPWATKISNKKPEQALKTYDSQKNSLLILYFWNNKGKHRLIVSYTQKYITRTADKR